MNVIISKVYDTTDYISCVDYRTCGDFEGVENAMSGECNIIAYDGGRIISIVDVCDTHGVEGAIASITDESQTDFEVARECEYCEEYADGSVDICENCADEIAREREDDWKWRESRGE